MNTHRSGIRAFGLTTATVIALTAGGIGAAATVSAGANTTKTIGFASLGHERKVELTATPSAGRDAETATVRVVIYRRGDGRWIRQDQRKVGLADAWTWRVVMGKNAICKFSTSNRPPERIVVKLLVNRHIGCSLPLRYHIENGQIVRN